MTIRVLLASYGQNPPKLLLNITITVGWTVAKNLKQNGNGTVMVTCQKAHLRRTLNIYDGAKIEIQNKLKT